MFCSSSAFNFRDRISASGDDNEAVMVGVVVGGRRESDAMQQ